MVKETVNVLLLQYGRVDIKSISIYQKNKTKRKREKRGGKEKWNLGIQVTTSIIVNLF